MHRQEPAAERPRWDKERSSRWGVILAGGDGTRLLPLTRKISGDDRPKPFAAHMDHAFSQAEMDQERVILLGILPDAPEESYGWIEPGESVAGSAVSEVRRFWEKPSRRVATRLMRGGCLWNSFVMVGRVNAFLAMIRRTLPELLTSFTGMQRSTLRAIYAKIPQANFSNEVLCARPSDLTVLPAGDLGWSDLGEPRRVLSAIRNLHTESALPGLEVPA